jgi:hypothetical protein
MRSRLPGMATTVLRRRVTGKFRVDIGSNQRVVLVLAIAGIHIAGHQRTTIVGLSDPRQQRSPATDRRIEPRAGMAERAARPNQYVDLRTTG